MEEATFSQVLDSIYDAAADFDRWPSALERVGEVFGTSYIGLIDRNLRTMEGRAIAIGVDQAGQREYFDVWSQRDVLRLNTRVFRPGSIELDHDILPRHDLLRSDYYNGFMKPRGFSGLMRMTLSIEDGFRKIISMSRPTALGNFDIADVEQCRRLMPHFQRAASVMRRVEQSKLVLSGFSDLMDQSATGVVLLDHAARVLFANRAARAMAQSNDGLLLRGQKIAASSATHDAALQKLIAGATGRHENVEAARGGVMRLPRASGKPDLAVAVSPLADGDAWTQNGPVVFLLLTDPAAASAPAGETITQLFGLSAAEARVAERLIAGDSPEQAAAFLNIKTSTARWHLAALYRKTGTKRQAQLVRLLMSLPAL